MTNTLTILHTIESTDRQYKIDIGTIESGALCIQVRKNTGRYEDGHIIERYVTPETIDFILSNASLLTLKNDSATVYTANNP